MLDEKEFGKGVQKLMRNNKAGRVPSSKVSTPAGNELPVEAQKVVWVNSVGPRGGCGSGNTRPRMAWTMANHSTFITSGLVVSH